MKGNMALLTVLLLFGSLAAETISAADISPTPTRLADYSYQTTLKNGTVVATDTVKNSINKATNTMLDCGILTCDYKVEVNAKQALTFDASTLQGKWTGNGVKVEKIFYPDTKQVEKTRPTYATEKQEQCTTDNKTSIKTCENTDVTVESGTETYIVTESFENTAVTTPFAKDEKRTYVIRFKKDSPNKNVDIYHSIYEQDRKDAAWWNLSWGYAIPCQINTTTEEALQNFPARCDLNTSNTTLWNTATCGNVRFLDSANTTALNYDVWDNSSATCGNASILTPFYISVNTTNSTTANLTIYAYLGNTGAANGENETGVWRAADAGGAVYTGVFHLAETAAPYKDSAGYANISNTSGSLSRVAGTKTPYALRVGAAGYGGMTNGTTYPHFVGTATGGFRADYNRSGVGGTFQYVITVGFENGATGGSHMSLNNRNSATEGADNMSCFTGNYWAQLLGNVSWGKNTYRCQINTTSNGPMVSFLNSTQNTVQTLTVAQNTRAASSLTIGLGNISRTTYGANGTIGELRLWNGTRTNGWIKAEDGAQTWLVGATLSNIGNLTVNATTGGSASGNDTFIPANISISATANTGYSFFNWTTNCTGSFTNASNASTVINITVNNTCYVQANFNENAPVIQTSTILPTTAYQYNNLSGYCNATTGATSVTYNYTWFKNGATNATGSVGPFTQGINTNVANISSASIAVGQNWTLQCLAYNAKGASSALNSSNKTILSTIPNITAISVIPASPTKANNLSCNLTVTDSEHATTNITGNWSKNGVVLLAFSYINVPNNTATIIANLTPGNFSKGDNISCNATAFDGIYNSPYSASANKTILNSAPASPTVNNFVNATTAHWFTVNGSVTDADGGTEIATATITPSLGSCVQMSNSTSGTLFMVKYNCTSTTNGTANITIGFTDTSSAYVNNSSTNAYPDHAASITVPTITPATIYTGTTATCNFGAFSDIDNDTENVSARTYAWQYNGGATGITTQTFDLTAYGANESANLSCSITSTNSSWKASNATNTSANKTILLNHAPLITIQNTFTNSTTGHSFTVFAGANETDAGDSIAYTNITTTAGTCNYVSNATSGGEMNVTYLCTSTASGTANITIRFTDTISGAYNTTTSSNNTYPDHAPTLSPPTITPALAHLNDTLTCNPGVYSDVDGDTENVSARIWAWYVNGVLTAATATLPSGAFAVGDNITCTENSTNSSWTLTAQASSAVFANVLGVYYTSYGNTSGVIGFGAAFDYSATAMTTATGNSDAFGLLIMATVFIGFYIIGSRYTQERALVYATFVTTVVAFLLVSGNFLSPNWLILSIIALLAAIYFANRVG